MIETTRLRLLRWQEEHREPFAAMHADPTVMADQGGALSPSESLAKFDRYCAAWSEHGISRWAVEDRTGVFLGYAGVMLRADEDHPLGRHFEIGWRFVACAWGHGYATESAKASFMDALARIGHKEILSYTSAQNLRSQAVMARLRLRRAPERDFTADYEHIGSWRGLVWVGDPEAQQ